MTLGQLRAFLAVVEARSFSKAALELGTAQSSVSYLLAELEAELGVKLLERGRFGAVPTEVGLEVAGHARRMMQLEAAITQQAGLARGVLKGTLCVATFRSVASRAMPAVVARLREAHPALAVNLVELDGNEGGLERALRRGRADVAFIVWPVAADLIAWELLHDAYVALLPRAWEFTGETIAAEALRRMPLILYDSHYCTFLAADYFHAPTPTPAYRVKEDSTIFSMVAQGLGASIVPSLILEQLPEAVQVVPLEQPFERLIGVAVLPGSLKIPAVRAFLRALKRQFPESAVPELDVKARAHPLDAVPT
jgi:DNA-binding transcriptional LysR family regulator